MQLSEKQHIFIGSLVLCTLLFLIPLNTSAQIVNIPDNNLRAAINETLGNEPNAQITKDEMLRLTHFEANFVNIRNLRGLDAATNLEDLRMDGNQISNLSPLAGLVKLRYIHLEENAISDLSPLAGLISLWRLNISHNSISDLSPLAKLTNLNRLAIHHNVVTDLSPLANLPKLESIGMSDNPFVDLAPLADSTSLINVHGWGTPILNIGALGNLPKMREINICGGDISDLSGLENLKSLKILYLPGNRVSDLSPIANLTGLTRINLEGNRVSDLSPLTSLSNLTWIDLSRNTVSDVSPLAELDNLAWIDLTENSVSDVSALAFLPNLNWLGLTNNILTDPTTLERFSEGTTITYSDFINSALPEFGPKIEGPWLWAIVPNAGFGTKDLLALASNGAATEVKVATFGATEDKVIGSGKWRAHTLSPTGGDNLNQMTDALGWGSGSDIYEHVVYGSVTLESPRRQETTMLVGSDDEVKVWLNGEVVHYNSVLRGAGDYQDAFPVTLKKGTNVLLVAVTNLGHGAFSGFFGFKADTKYTVNALGDPIVIDIAAWDVNKDGISDILDLVLVARDLGKTESENVRTDVNGDGKRNILDLTIVARNMNKASGAAAPSALAMSGEFIPVGEVYTPDTSTEMVRSWIAQAQAASDGSLVFRQGIANLKQLLASLIPESTTLLANYPNPFNPETWIPYQLAEPTVVTLHIYAVSGALVRTLALGHQSAGRYQDRSRAAYWDGKNEVGESVASGIYFYTLTAGDFTGTGKMVIKK